MPKRIIVLSGHVASGKSTLADNLADRYGVTVVKTINLIREQKGTGLERMALQEAGDALDRETRGTWVADATLRALSKEPEDATVLVDSVRIRAQCDELRRAFGSKVVHLHLTASQSVLASRYANRTGDIKELESYDALIANPTEGAIETLAVLADIVIDTERSTREDVVVRAASRLGLYGRGVDQLVDVLVGGQWGSEGKGNIAAYLAPEYNILLRVGGPNAGHKVYQEPAPSTFYHLPSGTLRAPDATIVLGPGATLWLPKLFEEINTCELEPNRLRIDPRAMIIELEDRKFEEGTLKAEIGSTAQGVGSATARKILRTAARPPVRLARDVAELAPYIRETLQVLDDAFSAGHRIFVEGTQGTGLSLHHGDYPHVTSRDTTVSGCLADAGIAPRRVRRSIMVCRTYPIRVQSPEGKTSGEMYQEISWETVEKRAGIYSGVLEAAEKTTTTNRKRRVAEFSWTLLREAASLNGPTDIALSFADYIDARNAQAHRFEQLTQETIQFIEEVERVTSAPVSLVATRFDYRNIIDRRTW
jgi:adenylosuccinate synthase